LLLLPAIDLEGRLAAEHEETMTADNFYSKINQLIKIRWIVNKAVF